MSKKEIEEELEDIEEDEEIDEDYDEKPQRKRATGDNNRYMGQFLYKEQSSTIYCRNKHPFQEWLFYGQHYRLQYT